MNTNREESPRGTTVAWATLPENQAAGATLRITLLLRTRWIEVLIVSLFVALSSPLVRQG
jgi:hypothetical protein